MWTKRGRRCLSALALLAVVAGCTIIPPPPPPVAPQWYGQAQPIPYGGPTQGAGPGHAGYPAMSGPGGMQTGATSDTTTDDRGRSIRLEHGAPGNPAVVGCADGRREAFLDLTRFPRIAGCLGSWMGRQSLRAAPTARACGDEIGPCDTPADLCAPGWHVCGANGAVQELRQVSAVDCETAGGGRFSAAISHCKAQQGCSADPSPAASYSCFEHGWCSEPVCCGRDCGQFGACRDGVWQQHTHIPEGVDQGCGSMDSHRAGGVLCCLG